MQTSQKTSRSFNVTLLIILHLLIVLPLAYSLNIWSDEASTLYTTQHGFLAAFQHAAADERQAPLYFWLMSLWRLANDSIFFARLFSVICTAFAIKVFADLARTLYAPRAALLATAFFALHPYLIWASLEIRVYSLVILLSVVLLRLFFLYFYREPEENDDTPGIRGTAAFCVVALIALYTNYYLGFLLAGCFVALLAGRQFRAAGRYLAAMVIAGAAFLPLIFAVRSQFAANTGGFYEETSLAAGLRLLWHHFLTFMLPSEVFPPADVTLADVIRLWSVRALLLVTAIFAIWRRRQISRLTVALGVITMVIFGWLFAAYLLLGPMYVEVRHASVVFVPLILFAAALVSEVFGTAGSGRGGRAATIVGGLLVLLSFSYAIITLYPNTAKRGDWARVGEYIQQNERPGQPIVIFHVFDAMALPYHYHGVNQIVPDKRFFDFDAEAAFGTAESLKAQTEFIISEIPAGAAEIWLVENEKCRVTEACVPLEKFVQANYTVTQEQDFYLERVRLLKRKIQ